MVDGAHCGSPAMRRNRFCYYHNRQHEERLALSTDRARNNQSRPFTLPPLADANTIQISLTEVMNLLLAGKIEHKTASLMLYSLQIATTNLQQARLKEVP